MKKLLKFGLLLTTLGATVPLHASPSAMPETWGGDISSRPRLTGDWGGVRDDMAKKGIVLDMDLYWMPQSIISGGRETASADWGNAILTLNVDTQKLGLWSGGHFKIQTVTSFEDTLLKEAGAVVPANMAWMLPDVKPETGLQELTYTHFFSPHFAAFVGKINTIAPTNQFHGDYRS
jgi:porin